jgi:uncharacterized protein YfaA (DUF2138 family)
MPLTTNLGVSQQDAGVAARVELRESVRRFRNRAWQSIGSIESSSLHGGIPVSSRWRKQTTNWRIETRSCG